MHVRMCIHVYKCIYTYYVCIILIYIYIYVCVCVQIYMYIFNCVCARGHAFCVQVPDRQLPGATPHPPAVLVGHVQHAVGRLRAFWDPQELWRCPGIKKCEMAFPQNLGLS